MNKILLATIRREGQIIGRRFAIVDLTFRDEEEILHHAEHQLRSCIEYTYCKLVFDFLPMSRLTEMEATAVPL